MMSRHVAAVVALGLTALRVGERHHRAVPSPVLAFTHVNVIDVEHGNMVRDRTVIVEGNRIRVVGASAATHVPPGALVVTPQGSI